MAKGYPIGQVCPDCTKGKLEAVMRSASNGTSSRGVIGIPLFKEVIDHLACSQCYRLFAACERGHTMTELLERPLKDFKNPEQRPEQCPHCRGELSTKFSDGFSGHRKPYYVYCSPCQKIVWLCTLEETDPGMADLLAKIKTTESKTPE